VAAREMGDANRWAELVWINRLTPPYITTDERQAGPTVLLAGALIKVPAPAGLADESAERGQVYERDCALQNKRLRSDGNGDFAVFAGADNLRQQLQHRVATPRGQARRHPEYGCLVYRLQGTVNGPTAAMLGAEYVKAALQADYRVSSVDSARADVTGDAVRIQARAVAIDGGVVDLSNNT
jgi:phage baseplate assembly protein W